MRTSVLAIGLSIAALGCTRETPIAIQLAVPSDFPTGRPYELFLFDGATCPDVDDVVLDALATPPRVRARGVEGMLGALGALDPGAYALAALVREEDCAPRLFGCAPFVLGEATTIRVQLADPSWTDARVCGGGRTCAGGICADGDGGAPPDGGTSCEDLAAVPFPPSCVRESECGPFGTATCRGVSCELCVPGVLTLTDVDIGAGAPTDVIGNRFALAVDATHAHVVAAVRADTGAVRVRRVSFALDDFGGVPLREDVPATWALTNPYAVGLGPRPVDAEVRITVYDETGEDQMCGSAFSGAEPFAESCGRIFSVVEPIAEPAFTGTGADQRQVWVTLPEGGIDLTSVSWSAACETALTQRDLSFSIGAAGLTVLGTTGRWTAIGPSRGGDLLLFDSQPEGNARPLPCVEATGDAPQPVSLEDRTGRFAFVHLEDDRYALAYPAGGDLAIRSATCDADRCSVSDDPLRTVALGRSADLLSAVPLTAPDGRTEGFALALARRSCAGLPEIEIVVFDERFEPVAVYPVQTGEVVDVRLEVSEGMAPSGERRRILVLATLTNGGGSLEASIFLGGVVLDAACDV